MSAFPLRRLIPRYSLRSLVIFTLLATAAMGLWFHWEAWHAGPRLGGPKTSSSWCYLTNDGRSFLISDGTGTKLWDTVTGRLGYHLERHRMKLFSRDNCCLMTVGPGDMAVVWRVEDGSRVAELEGRVGGMASATFSRDRRRVLILFENGPPRLWDAQSGKLVAVLEGHEGSVLDSGSSPDGRLLVTTGADRTARIWEASSGKCVRVLKGHKERVWHCWFAPQGGRVMTWSFEHTWHIWDTATGKHVAELRRQRLHDFSPDGRMALTGEWDKKTVTLWNLADGTVLRIFGPLPTPPGQNSFSPSGKRVLAAVDDAVRIWDVHTGRLISVLPRQAHDLFSADYAADERRVFTCDSMGNVMVWDVETGKPLHDFSGLGVWDKMDEEGNVLVLDDDTSPERPFLIYHRRRPEWWWGIFWLWEFWLVVFFAVSLGASLWGDRRSFRKLARCG